MKKAFLTIALAAFALASNAQFYIGGNIGFGMFNGSTDFTRVQGETTSTWTIPNAIANPGPLSYDALNETMTLSVMPKIGYMLDEKMQFGLAFGIVWDKSKDYSMYANAYRTNENFEGWQSTSQLSVCATPYFRYNLTDIGKLTLFAEAQLGLAFGLTPTVHRFNTEYQDGNLHHAAVDEDVAGMDYNFIDVSLSVIPGIHYRMSDNLSVDLYVNVLRLGFEYKHEDYYQDRNLIDNTPNAPANTFEWVVNSTNVLFSAGNSSLFTVGFNYIFF